MAREFVRDIREGFRGTDIRAGLLKCAADFEGVDLTRVKIDHSNDTTDLEYLQWILDQGCWLGLDRYPGRLVSPHMRTVTLKALMDLGYGARLLPSHDCICLHVHNERPDGTLPDVHEFTTRNPDQYFYTQRHVIPDLLEQGASPQAIRRLFVDNPRRFFGG
jgi:phosphotriesterase-related protein